MRDAGMKQRRTGRSDSAKGPPGTEPKALVCTAIEPLLTVDQVATILGVCERTVMRMVADGRLDKVQGLGRAVRLHPRSVRNLIDSK